MDAADSCNPVGDPAVAARGVAQHDPVVERPAVKNFIDGDRRQTAVVVAERTTTTCAEIVDAPRPLGVTMSWNGHRVLTASARGEHRGRTLARARRPFSRSRRIRLNASCHTHSVYN